MRQLLLISGTVGCLALLLVHYLSGRTMLGDTLDELWPLYLSVAGIMLMLVLCLNAPRHAGWPVTRVALASSALLISETEIWELGLLGEAKPVATPDAPSLKVATFNVWASNIDIEATTEYLVTGNFDLISAQEVGLASRTLPERLRTTYPHQFTCGRGVYVYSRRPFLATGCPDIPVGLSRSMPLAWVDIEWDGAPVRFVAAHLARPLEMRWRRPQITRLESFIQANSGRSVMLAGDFNTGHAGRSAEGLANRLAPMERRDSRRPSWPSARLGGVPLLALDQIWLSDDLCLITDSLGPPLGSDHRPVTGIVSRCSTVTSSPAAR